MPPKKKTSAGSRATKKVKKTVGAKRGKKSAKKASKKKAHVGRPHYVYDYDEIEKLGSYGCTQGEMADLLGVSIATVERRMADDERFKAAYDRGLSAVKKRLRSAQIEMATSGDKGASTMLIWLGKQLLGQRDTPQEVQIEHSSWAVRRRLAGGGTAYYGPGEDPFDDLPDSTDTTLPE